MKVPSYFTEYCYTPNSVSSLACVEEKQVTIKQLICCFHRSYNKTPGRDSLRKVTFTFAHSFWGASPSTWGKLARVAMWQQECIV